jgi:NAD(P)-dependent dehydrogenase (short-subunit alcohol dehydrogenase family)
MEHVWFITGSSRGFGRALVQAALDAGDLVVATARRPGQLAELTQRYGDRMLPVALDVTDGDAVRQAVNVAVERFGRLDVVVNNAGYANLAPIETAEEADFRAQFETNFWGVYNVSKAVIPQLRAQGGGTIVQFSSVGGRVGGSPGIASYQAAKFAVDGFSRVLAAETAPFGVRVMVVEPSGFATDWAGSSMTIHDIPADYDATIGAMHRLMRANPAGPAGDPVRAAQIIVQAATRANPPAHLLLGVTAVEMALAYSRRQLAEASAWEAVSRSADYAEPYPAEFPEDKPELSRTYAAYSPGSRYSISPGRLDSSFSRLGFLGGRRLTSMPLMNATPLTTIVGPFGSPVPLDWWSKAPMTPTPVTRTLASSGTVTSMPPMIANTWSVTVCAAYRASRRSSSPPPMKANAVNSSGTTQSPFLENPPMMANAPCDVASPPNRCGLPAGAGAGTRPPAVCGRSLVMGSSSA